jgi:hypothetical protein
VHAIQQQEGVSRRSNGERERELVWYPVAGEDARQESTSAVNVLSHFSFVVPS